jgi:hypothetical protein
MSYLNVDLDFYNHPKTVRLVGLIGPHAGDHVIRLWCYVGKYHSTDGEMRSYNTSEVESAARWAGTPGQLLEALIKVGFLEPMLKHAKGAEKGALAGDEGAKLGDGGYRVTDWLQHQGHLKFFKIRAKMAADKRWHVSSATSNAPNQTKPNQTKPNQTGACIGLEAEQSFEEIWALYPNKDGKKDSRRHFIATVKTPDDLQNIRIALNNYLQSDKVKRGFVKDGKTWFNNWQDWLHPTDAQLHSGKGGGTSGDNTAGTVSTDKYDKAGFKQ